MKNFYSYTICICFALVFINIFPSIAFSEDISLCKGVWTSKPCTEAEKSFEASNKPIKEKKEEIIIQEEIVEEVKEESKNESIVHDLKIKSLNIKEKYGSQYDLRLLEEACNEEAITSENCNKKITEETAAIRDYELRLREISLEEEKLKREEEGGERQNIQTNTIANTTIIQNNPSTLIKKHVEVVPKAEPQPSPKSEIIRSVNNVREAGRFGR
jgi:hypothetical protein